MGQAGRAEQTIRFGVFEVDLRSGELRKAGLRIKLQEQPFKVLTALLEHPGKVVTRKELRGRIWPHESSGDFDHAVNIAVAKLRTALGDSADAPHLIETLHRRGYRFIFPVADLASREQSMAVVVRAPTGNEAKKSGAEVDITPTDNAGSTDSTLAISRWVWLIAGFVLIVALGGTIAWLSRPLPPPRVLKVVQITREKFDLNDVLTDGSRLYVTESTGSNQFLVQTSVAGGETSVIPTPFANIAISDLSPDHSQLLVTDVAGTENDYPLWILPLPGGTPRRVGNVVAHWILWETGWAVWSPDGRRIAFAKDSNIYTANVQGADIRKVVTLSGPATEICFSPDGAHLRFTVWSPQHDLPSIWEVNSDGTNLHPLLPNWHGPANKIAGAWSPDGRYYFFSGCNEAGHCSVWAIREAPGLFQRSTLSPFQLTTGPMLFFNGASPDGRTLLGSSWSTRLELIRYDLRSHQFVPFLGGIAATDLDFSRDGKWVAYVSSPGGTLWRSRVDGSERLQLTSPPVSALQPRWSPDGTQIAYVDNQGGSTWKIFLIPAQGGTPQEILSENVNQLDPSWSPDGTRLVFGRAPWLGASGEKISIQILDLNSKQVSIVPGSQKLFAPRFSPDGEHLAAVSVGNNKLLLFNFKTNKWTDWIDEPGTVVSPAWSRDGKYIYYINTSTKDPAYRRARVGRTRSEFLIDLKGLNLGTSRLGPWSGMAPNGSALFNRNLSTSDIYSLTVELP